MINIGNRNNSIISLFSQHSQINKNVLRFLAIEDITQLQQTSKDLYYALSTNDQLTNWLYYSEYLAIQRSYSVDKQSYYLTEENYAQRVWALCSNQNLNFSPVKKQLKSVEKKVILALTSLIDNQQSLLILQQFKRILIDPQPPRPVMRRKTVGECCRSSIQIKIATEGYTSPQQIYLSQEDETLKRALLEKAEIIAESMAKPSNLNTILQIRYRAQLKAESQIIQDPLISIIQLILKITKLHISSIKSYLEAAQQNLTEVQFLQQYIYRFSTFRNSTMELDQKFQYIFQHFEFAFKQVFRNYPLRPRFNLWRFMIKQWNIQMKHYHQIMNKISSKIFIHIVQKQIQSSIINETADQETYSEFNNCFHLQKFKAPQTSDLNVLFYDSYALSTFLEEYSESVIDVSTNAYNVHWYGSSELRLGNSYVAFQTQIIQHSKKYHQSIINSFSSQYVKIKLCEFFAQASRNYLKPCTAHKLQNTYKMLAIQIIDNTKKNEVCSNWFKEWTFPCYSWYQDNNRIKQLNKSRKVAQQTAQQLVMFFSLQQEIQIECINQVVAKYKQDHSEYQEESLEESRGNLA